jgi:hypothetical protein
VTVALIIVTSLLLVATATVAIRRRGGMRRQPSKTPGAGTALDELEDSLDSDDVLLLPVPNSLNEGLVLGSASALEAFDHSGLSHRSARGGSGPLPQVVRKLMATAGTGATNVAGKQVESGRLVALSTETMEALRKGPPAYDKAGNMLGLVRGDRGRIAHVMRLDKGAAKAMVASNAATLAMTAAVSQQLEHIEQQLAELGRGIDLLAEEKRQERFANAVAANRVLQKVADNITRHGEISDADWDLVASEAHHVHAADAEVQLKFTDLIEKLGPEATRKDRVEELERLIGEERLEYWLALRTEVELAQTRWDLLHLYWEQSRHPESAAVLAEETRVSVNARQQRLHEVGLLLDALADPESRTLLDPLRQASKRKLVRHDEFVGRLLDCHAAIFVAPADSAYTVRAEPDLALAPGPPEDIEGAQP